MLSAVTKPERKNTASSEPHQRTSDGCDNQSKRPLLARDAVDRPDRSPRLAARTLPVVRLGAEPAAAAAVHGLAFDQLSRQILQNEQVFARFALGLVECRANQGHEAAHRRPLAQL